MEQIKRPQVLVLSAQSKFADAVASLLWMRGLEVREVPDSMPDPLISPDAVVIDTFFAHAGIPEFCRGAYPRAAVVLFMDRRENPGRWHACLSEVDEAVLLPHGWEQDIVMLARALETSGCLRSLRGCPPLEAASDLFDALHATYQLSLG